MPKTKTAAAPAAKPKTHRSVRARKSTTAAPAATAEFDPLAHHEEIAQEAYLIWLGRAECAGSPEEDWLQAELQVRARYAQ